MANAVLVEYEAVLGVVGSWPAARRLALIQDVLRAFHVEARSRTIDRDEPDAFGLLADAGASVTDDDLARLVRRK